MPISSQYWFHNGFFRGRSTPPGGPAEAASASAADRSGGPVRAGPGEPTGPGRPGRTGPGRPGTEAPPGCGRRLPPSRLVFTSESHCPEVEPATQPRIAGLRGLGPRVDIAACGEGGRRPPSRGGQLGRAQVLTASANGSTAGTSHSRSSFAPTVIVQPVLKRSSTTSTGWPNPASAVPRSPGTAKVRHSAASRWALLYWHPGAAPFRYSRLPR